MSIDGGAVHQVGPRAPRSTGPYSGVAAPPPPAAREDRPMGLGRKGERVANTPMRVLPPSRGGPHRGGPALPHRLGELPDQPEVAEALQPPQGVGIAVLRLKDHRGPQGVHQPALPGNAELGGKVAADAGDDAQLQLLFHLIHLMSPPYVPGGGPSRSRLRRLRQASRGNRASKPQPDRHPHHRHQRPRAQPVDHQDPIGQGEEGRQSRRQGAGPSPH